MNELVSSPNISRADETAFRALYGSLRKFASVVGPWELEPDDLVQEALLQVLRNGSLSRLDNPPAYLRRTILNLSYNHFRRRETGGRAVERYVAGWNGTETAEYPSDLTDLLSLEPTERAILYFHDVHGYTFAEIARAIDTPESTCRQIASRARHRLRDTIIEEATQ